MMVVPFQAKDSENPFAVKIIAYFFMLITDERWGELGTGSSPNDTVVSLNTSVASLTEDGFENFPLWILKLCERVGYLMWCVSNSNSISRKNNNFV